MKLNLACIGKLLSLILLVYLLYVILTAILPYAFPKPVSDSYKAKFSALDFSGHPSLDRVALVETSKDAFRYRIQLLQSAEHTIDITCHTISTGISTDYFLGEVIRAANRGVNVRFIIDGKMGGLAGSRSSLGYALFTHPNIEYRTYNPMGLLTPWKWNSLLHDKFLIVDDKFLLLGGRNIGDIYFNPPGHTDRLTLDRDVFVFNTAHGTKISNDSVITDVTAYMDSLMDSDAAQKPFRVFSASKRAYGASTQARLITQVEAFQKENPALYALPTMEDYLLLTVPTKGITLLSNPIHTNVKEAQVAYGIAQLALQSEKSVLLQTPYATANKKLLAVMKTLGEKDIEFEMLTNSIGPAPNLPAFSNYYYNRKKFLKTGVTIYEFQQREGLPQGSIHAKSYLFDDDLSAVGSLNLDDRSFHLSTETMLVINSPEFNAILRDTMEGWQSDSLVVGENNKYLPDQEVPENEATVVKHVLMFIVSIFSRLFQFLI